MGLEVEQGPQQGPQPHKEFTRSDLQIGGRGYGIPRIPVKLFSVKGGIEIVAGRGAGGKGNGLPPRRRNINPFIFGGKGGGGAKASGSGGVVVGAANVVVLGRGVTKAKNNRMNNVPKKTTIGNFGKNSKGGIDQSGLDRELEEYMERRKKQTENQNQNGAGTCNIASDINLDEIAGTSSSSPSNTPKNGMGMGRRFRRGDDDIQEDDLDKELEEYQKVTAVMKKMTLTQKNQLDQGKENNGGGLEGLKDIDMMGDE